MAIRAGSKVAYSTKFLDSIREADFAEARGSVKEIITYGPRRIAIIEWDKPNIPTKVLIDNLEEVR